MAARRTKAEKLHDERVSRLIQANIYGWQIPIMKLSVISKAANEAARLSDDDAVVAEAVVNACRLVGEPASR